MAAAILKENSAAHWNSKVDASLTLPQADAGHLLPETDASEYAIGSPLYHKSRPKMFLSRTLSQCERNLFAAIKEALPIFES